VTQIGTSAFAGHNLTDIYIPDGVVQIGDSAFASNALQAVYLPDSVRAVGRQSFGMNPLLKKVSIGSKVRIAADSFSPGFMDAYMAEQEKAGVYQLNKSSVWVYMGLN
jgi:hypothetical protein